MMDTKGTKKGNLGLYVAGKCISNSLSECRSIACSSLIEMIFFCEYQLRIPSFYHVCLYCFCLQWQQFLLNF